LAAVKAPQPGSVTSAGAVSLVCFSSSRSSSRKIRVSTTPVSASTIAIASRG
jgi:hypothetical protein